MAGYKVHISVSLLFCGLLYLFPFWQPLPWTGKLLCVALAVFFGLWPDVDTKSKGQSLFLSLFLILDVVLIVRRDYKRAAYLGLLIVIPVIARHRGWTHSSAAMILLPGTLYLAAVHYTGNSPTDGFPYFLAAFLGYASHLAVDRVL